MNQGLSYWLHFVSKGVMWWCDKITLPSSLLPCHIQKVVIKKKKNCSISFDREVLHPLTLKPFFWSVKHCQINFFNHYSILILKKTPLLTPWWFEPLSKNNFIHPPYKILHLFQDLLFKLLLLSVIFAA